MALRVTLTSLLVLVTLLTACGDDRTTSAGQRGAGPVRVAASISVLGDLVAQVGGERVTVIGLIPPGADGHTFQPAPRDVKQLADVRAVFLNGLGLEERLAGVIANNVPKSAPVVELAAGLPTLEGDEHGANPHLWLDATLAARYVERIRDTLSGADPEGAAAYQANATRYLAELAQLDADLRAQIATIPAAQRKLVTFHDAFPYFAQAYGLELVGFVVRSPGREPSAREVKDLGETLRAQGVRTVYKEPQLNAKLLEQAAKDAGVKVDVLYSDALTGDIATYVAMMRRNGEHLVRGLR